MFKVKEASGEEYWINPAAVRYMTRAHVVLAGGERIFFDDSEEYQHALNEMNLFRRKMYPPEEIHVETGI